MQLLHFQSSLGPVSYRLIGDGNRKVVFFHGFPGSSSQLHLFLSSLVEHQMQVLCFDRPGYNKTFSAGADMLNVTSQITYELTAYLSWQKFEVVTVSGGTPYGISFAQKFPESVSGVRVICGLGYIREPQIRKYITGLKYLSLLLLRFVPGWALRLIINPDQKKVSNKRRRFFELFYPTSESDRQIISERNLGGTLGFVLNESLMQNGRGPVSDTKVFLSDWGADLGRFSLPIHFWHGDEDKVIS